MDWSFHGSLGQLPYPVCSDEKVCGSGRPQPPEPGFRSPGIPPIVHSDNGREFVNDIVQEWPGQITVVNGRPRNPKCQGLVEQGNHMVKKLLGAHLHEYKGDGQPTWTEWLPFIQCTFSLWDSLH